MEIHDMRVTSHDISAKRAPGQDPEPVQRIFI